MQKLTLTGATMVSKKKDDDAIEMTPPAPSHSHGGGKCEHDHDHGGHSHKHNQHDHSHGHSHSHGSNHPAVARVVYTPPTKEEILKASNDEIRTSLQALIRLGGYKEAFEPLITLILEHRPAAKEEILNTCGDDHYSLLHWAAKRVDDVRFLQLICDMVKPETINMPSTDSVAMLPLHWCATEGGLPHASVLLQHGANLEGQDGAGCTPLLIAAQYGQVDLVAFLLQRGANGVAVDKNRDSALHWAAYKGSIHVCGHLLYRDELSWTTQDAFGQTPLHLAALRGNTPVVRYLLQQSPSDVQRMLRLPDKNDKTPLDLAIFKKKPTVEAVLREAQQGNKWESKMSAVTSMVKQMFSFRSWSVWMGCSMATDNDTSPKFPHYFMLLHMGLYTLWYPLVFTPILSISSGVMWDFMGLHVMSYVCLVCMWYCAYKIKTTSPGTLDETLQHKDELAHYRKMYEETIESFSKEGSNASQNKGQLCHTCHILKPLRSKHCRDLRRCVLMFDHHCPFVGNTVGLYNYKWFYFMLASMSMCCLLFGVTLWHYLHRSFSWPACIFGIYLVLFILFAGGMLVYHTQLTMMNLTTNEHINLARYKYLQSNQGQFRNPFFKSWGRNTMDRLFFPSNAMYTLPANQLQEQEELLRGDDAV